MFEMIKQIMLQMLIILFKTNKVSSDKINIAANVHYFSFKTKVSIDCLILLQIIISDHSLRDAAKVE